MSADALQIHEIVDRYVGALESGDIEAMLTCYASDVCIWHNFDELEMTADEHVKSVQDFFDTTNSRKFLRIQRGYFQEGQGIVQQHVLRMETKAGVVSELPGCIVFRTNGSKITRLDEYVDLSGVTPK